VNLAWNSNLNQIRLEATGQAIVNDNLAFNTKRHQKILKAYLIIPNTSNLNQCLASGTQYTNLFISV